MSGIITNKESLTTKLTLIIVGLTAASGLLIPATYASFHPVTTGEIADNTILSADIRNGELRLADIATNAVTSGKISDTNGVYSIDIADGQVASVDIQDGNITRNDIAPGSLPVAVQTVIDQELGIRPGQYGQAIVPCPQGTIVTGGGFSTNMVDMKLTFNGPYQNGWYAAAYNVNAARDGSVAAYALCLSHIR